MREGWSLFAAVDIDSDFMASLFNVSHLFPFLKERAMAEHCSQVSAEEYTVPEEQNEAPAED